MTSTRSKNRAPPRRPASSPGSAPRRPTTCDSRSRNAGGSDSEAASNFTTSGSPVVQTQSASDVRDTSATLGGKVNPIEGPVTYQFQWGVDAGGNDETFENTAPLEPEALPFEDQTLHVVTTPLTELEPATNYHFRIVAKNTLTGEETFGVGRVFTTRPTPVPPEPCPNEASRVGLSAALPDCRVYEYATPHLNGSAPVIWPGYETKGVAPDGSAVAWGGADAPDNAEGSTSVTNTMVGLRGPDGGWTSKSLSAGTPGGLGHLLRPQLVDGRHLRRPAPVAGLDEPETGRPTLPAAPTSTCAAPTAACRSLTRIGAPTYGYGGELDRRLEGLHPPLHRLDRATVRNRPRRRAQSLRMVERRTQAGHDPARRRSGSAGRQPADQPGLDAARSPTTAAASSSTPPGCRTSTCGSTPKKRSTSPPRSALRRTPNRSPPRPRPGSPADGSEVVFTSHSELTEDANTGGTAAKKPTPAATSTPTTSTPKC